MKPRLSQTRRLFLSALSILVICAVPAFAGEGDGGQAGEFLRYGASVRSLGMGRAYVAAANDGSAMYYNPAGLTRLSNKYSVYFMGFKPLMESNYYFFSAALARPDSMAVGLKGFFFGPEAAWGFAAVHMKTGGFEYRDANDRLLDSDFSMYQQAGMLSFAREFSGTQGILGIGLNLKVVRQGVGNTDTPLKGSAAGFGLDFGAQLQMINPALLKRFTSVPLIGPFFKLKHLLPLRLGLNVQNLIKPKVKLGAETGEYPTSLRFGGSYFFDNPRWLDGLNLFESSRITLVSDLEKVFADQRGVRWFTGIELEGQINDISLMFPRFGFNSADGPSSFGYGFGLKYAFDEFALQFDFAHGLHPELDNDPRVSVTLIYGGKRDAHYFARGEQTHTSLSPRDAWLQVLSGYPDNSDYAKVAAARLAESLDTNDSVNVARYYDFIGGPVNARFHARNAIRVFRAVKGDLGAARTDAEAAVSLFDTAYAKTPQLMEDGDHLLHGQCEMIVAATSKRNDSLAARDAWTHGAEVLARSSQVSLKKHFLIGTCWQKTRDYSKAAEQFRAGLKISDDDSQSLHTVTRLQLGDALLKSARGDSSIVDAAIDVLSELTNDPSLPVDSLAEDYPPFWKSGDMRIPDDAQYLIAQCYEAKKDSLRAAAEYVKVCRFYPGSDKCSEAKRRADQLIEELINR